MNTECPKTLREVEIERAYAELRELREAEAEWQREAMEKMASQEQLAVGVCDTLPLWERLRMVPGLG